MAPTCRVTSRPSLNNAIVGIALMRKRRARFCASSVLTFATTHLPAPSCATLFSSGATILHGPHQGAQKSTNTGRAERAVKASNARSFATSIGSPGALSSVPHFPQRPVPPSLSYFRRLRWPHFGQVTNTPRSSSCVEFIENFIVATYVGWSPSAWEKIRQQTSNTEHRIPHRALCIGRSVFGVRCSMFASTLDARFHIDESCAIGPTWETAGRCRGFTSRYRRVRSPGPRRGLRDLSLRRALSRWHLSH